MPGASAVDVADDDDDDDDADDDDDDDDDDDEDEERADCAHLLQNQSPRGTPRSFGLRQ